MLSSFGRYVVKACVTTLDTSVAYVATSKRLNDITTKGYPPIFEVTTPLPHGWLSATFYATISIQSHEEWANQQGYELEALLDAGWVRVQSVPPAYLLLDFRVRLNASQVVTVGVLFENRYDQVVVEFRGDARSFSIADEAMKYVVVPE